MSTGVFELSTKAVFQCHGEGDGASVQGLIVPSVSLCIAGIGASAGGFDAIRDFFQTMPPDSGVAFVVVQHLHPSRISLAAELFAKFTSMPVTQATDGAVIEANHVYTSPSDFRVIRELLINIAKHAKVEKAMVSTTRCADDTLLITVSDAGTGFDPDVVTPSSDAGGFGLLSVRERINLLGGEMSINSTPGQGTVIVLKVPLLVQGPSTTPITGGQA